MQCSILEAGKGKTNAIDRRHKAKVQITARFNAMYRLVKQAKWKLHLMQVMFNSVRCSVKMYQHFQFSIAIQTSV